MDGGDPAGGSSALAGLIDKYGEVLVPDLLHYYGVDLRDIFDEDHPLSARYILALVKYLPLESAFVAERRGGQQFRGWGPLMYAVVAAVNALRAIQHMYLLAHLAKNSPKPKAPEPYPIPDTYKQRKSRNKPGTFAHIAATKLAALRRRKAQG